MRLRAIPCTLIRRFRELFHNNNNNILNYNQIFSVEFMLNDVYRNRKLSPSKGRFVRPGRRRCIRLMNRAVRNIFGSISYRSC